MINKILIKIDDLKNIEEYKKIGITNFLFAINDFSLSDNCFNIEELSKLDVNIYLDLNRIINTTEIEKLKKIKNQLNFASGILFEDLGIYQVLKDSKIALIWNQKHFVINSTSINFWLDRVDSAVLSNELTKDEIEFILQKVNKPVILPVYGYNQAMYTKRKLLTFFNQAKGIELIKDAKLMINDDGFMIKEINDETVFSYHKPFNYLSYIKELPADKIKLYLIDAPLSPSDIINENHPLTEHFLINKTIYKLEERI